MELTSLFTMQRDLDSFIQSNHEGHADLFTKKGLALLVELSELANETRCFKFWSHKEPSPDHIIIEEYVDSIHFLLSLGIEKGFDSQLEEWPSGEVAGSLTELFIETNNAINHFLLEPTIDHYKKIWIYYGSIAKKLNFTNKDVWNAYMEKNEENYARQRKGY
ncbi:dUTP diphosphatase [Sporosarcina sp. Te-1]|uniref:dUTP diphosphatase n=1 Tax=Sporosarcina sp. Te-1 TaxID=2818390 RepID=UPI001A9F09C8|nr:dUTP diphosphatase [Sporosarcina sp. Te-1]QTD41460.1 dUTP diphosphatase [Sporosarcina sp. Te-1]